MEQSSTSLGDFVRALGHAEIAKRVGVRPKAVYEATYRGSLPSRWWLAVRDLAQEQGRDCPSGFFGFVEPDLPPGGAE